MMEIEERASTSSGAAMPHYKSALAFLARYGTIIGLGLMIATFAIISPVAFPTFSNAVRSGSR